jgi:hypothetical protein
MVSDRGTFISHQTRQGNLNTALTLTQRALPLPRRQADALARRVLLQVKEMQRANACRILKHGRWQDWH